MKILTYIIYFFKIGIKLMLFVISKDIEKIIITERGITKTETKEV